MALGTGSWFPHGPGHDVEAGHEDDVARGLEADDALLLPLVRNRAPRFLLGDLRRRGGEGVVQLGESGRVAPRRRDVEVAQLLDERSARWRVKFSNEFSLYRIREPKSTSALRPLSRRRRVIIRAS